jgi:hypothetical protein
MRRFDSLDKGFAQQSPGLANCGWSEPWEGAKRLTWANGTPEPPKEAGRIQSCYVQLGRTLLFYLQRFFKNLQFKNASFFIFQD